MNILEVLTKARELLSDTSRWNKGRIASDARDLAVGSLSVAACKWGLLGALENAQSSSNFRGAAYDRLDALCIKRGYSRGDVSRFDANATHEELMDLFSDAITSVLNEQSKQ